MKRPKPETKPDAAEIQAEVRARNDYVTTVAAARKTYRCTVDVARERLAKALATKSTEYQRDLMRAHHKSYYRRELEKDPGFLGWLGQRDHQGYEQYEMKCGRCAGRERAAFMGPGKSNCGRCRGTGRETFPKYCEDCDCLLPHPSGTVCYH